MASYYLDVSARSKKVADISKSIIDYHKKGYAPNWYLMIPNIAIAEVFSIFAKYCFGKWNPHVKKNLQGGLDTRKYKSIVKQFRNDIHNGSLFHQIELNRYHILLADLIYPFDHYYQIYRGSKRKVPMQTSDILILAMGIDLNHQFGEDRFCILTADNRMYDLCVRIRGGIKDGTVRKLWIEDSARRLGKHFSPDMYPRVINIGKATKAGLAEAFGEWPLVLPVNK